MVCLQVAGQVVLVTTTEGAWKTASSVLPSSSVSVALHEDSRGNGKEARLWQAGRGKWVMGIFSWPCPSSDALDECCRGGDAFSSSTKQSLSDGGGKVRIRLVMICSMALYKSDWLFPVS